MARNDIGQSHYAHLRQGTSKSLLSGLKLKKDALILIEAFTLFNNYRYFYGVKYD